MLLLAALPRTALGKQIEDGRRERRRRMTRKRLAECWTDRHCGGNARWNRSSLPFAVVTGREEAGIRRRRNVNARAPLLPPPLTTMTMTMTTTTQRPSWTRTGAYSYRETSNPPSPTTLVKGSFKIMLALLFLLFAFTGDYYNLLTWCRPRRRRWGSNHLLPFGNK